MRRTESVAALQLFNSMVIEDMKNSEEPVHSLLLLIVLTQKIIERSLDPSENFDLILKNCQMIAKQPNSTNIILFLLAEILQSTAIFHVPKLILILENLIIRKKLGHPIIQHMVIDGLIQVLALTSFSSGNLGGIERLMNFIRHRRKQNTVSTLNFTSSYINMCPELVNARDISILLESRQSFPFQEDSTKIFWTRNQLVLRGFFHIEDTLEFEEWNGIFMTLIQVSQSDAALKCSLVMPLLYKLSSTSNHRIRMAILQNMVQLGATTEMIGAIKALSKGMLRSMSIDLYLRLWRVEPRTYPFLHKVLTEKSNNDDLDFGLEIVRAIAINNICHMRPQHGSDLINVLSEILNNSSDLKNGDIAASLCLDSIASLCKNNVINIVSTWNAISLTTKDEKRPRVLESLCKFMTIVPSLKQSTPEYENVVKDIIIRLWKMTLGTRHEIKCATRTLKSWKLEDMTIDMIPVDYRISASTTDELSETSILDLPVPGECFIQLLTKVNSLELKSTGDLLCHYIEREVAEFRSGHYIVKEGHPEPSTYKTLQNQSILKALVNFVIIQASTNNPSTLVTDCVIVEALRILSYKYSRPLPPLNWDFLHKILNKSQDIKRECIRIAAKQAVISGTAKRLTENFLLNIDENFDDMDIALHILIDICNEVSPEIIQRFFATALRNACENKVEKVLASIKHCLSNEKLVTNRENLSSMILVYISSNKNSNNLQLIKMIPPKILDSIDFQLSKQQKTAYRCEILKNSSSVVENTVGWLSELVIEQLIQNDHREFLVDMIEELFINSRKFPLEKWLMDFIVIIEQRFVEGLEEDKIEFLLEIFVVSVVALSGYDKVFNARKTSNKSVISSRLQLLPQSIELLSRQACFHENIGNIFKFLLHNVNRVGVNGDIRHSFRASIILSKDNVHFIESKTWNKFLDTN